MSNGYNKERHIKIFNRWLKENRLYFKYMNETRQECIYLKKIPYNTSGYIIQRLNEEEEGASAIIRLTIDWFDLVYDLNMWRCAVSRWENYCRFHNIE